MRAKLLAGIVAATALSTSVMAMTIEDMSVHTALELAQRLTGNNPSITISNATFNDANVSAGIFDDAAAEGFGISSGIILSSGNIADAPGPNDNDGISTANGTPGDSDLDAIAGADTYDAAVLEFDFTTTNDQIAFQYVFASDEYNEFVGQFNDAFAFIVDGTNIALIPGASTPVSINNVNNTNNSAYYNSNDPSDGTPTPFLTQYDGFTTVLTAQTTVTPGVTHHIKIAVADTSDTTHDSTIFLKAGSFTDTPPASVSVPLSPLGKALLLMGFGLISLGFMRRNQVRS